MLPLKSSITAVGNDLIDVHFLKVNKTRQVISSITQIFAQGAC